MIFQPPLKEGVEVFGVVFKGGQQAAEFHHIGHLYPAKVFDPFRICLLYTSEIIQNAIQIAPGELQIVIGQDSLLCFYRIYSIRPKTERCV